MDFVSRRPKLSLGEYITEKRFDRFCFSVMVNRNNAAVVSWESERHKTVTLWGTVFSRPGFLLALRTSGRARVRVSILAVEASRLSRGLGNQTGIEQPMKSNSL
ncbi:hypothetical protein YC2023_005007 [Brassica napus]